MHRIDNPSAASVFPIPPPQGPEGYFTAGDIVSGQQPTIVEADWLNSMQEELCNVVTAGAVALSKTDNTQLLRALRALFLTRTLITANTTIYVNTTTGNDANNGQTPAAAFKTLQAAIYAVYHSYDWNGHNCNIQLADGTYLASGTGGWVGFFTGLPFGMGPNGLSLTGNVGLPGNVILSGPNANCISISLVNVLIQGVTFTCTGSVNTPSAVQGYGLAIGYSAIVTVQAVRFQSCGLAQWSCTNGGTAVISGNAVVFTGTTQYAMVIQVGGQFWFPGVTINVTGLTTTAGLAVASECGTINPAGATFVGTPTGPRYSVSANGVINTNGGGPTFFPGTVAGSSASGGQYL